MAGLGSMLNSLGIGNRGSSPRLILRKIIDLRSGDAALFVVSLSVLKGCYLHIPYVNVGKSMPFWAL